MQPISKEKRSMASFLSFLLNFGLLIARLGLGGILLLHGWIRWNAGVQAQVDYLTRFQTPYAEVAAWGAIIFELVGGVLLIVGALTRFVGLGVLIEQILIIAYTNWYKWPPTLLNADGTYRGGYEYNVALGLLGLLLFVAGGGAVSIDRLFRRKKPVAEDEEDYAGSTTRLDM
jgi:putative oxidoreductase